MAPSYEKCAACNNLIQNREFLSCGSCKLKYDIHCIGITLQRFQSFYGPNQDRRRNWKCPECLNRLPKTDNTNTPAKSTARSDALCEDSLDNVTVRKRITTCTGETDNISQSVRSPPFLEACQEAGKYHGISKEEWIDLLKTTIEQTISAQLKDITDQVSDIRESMSFFNKQYEDMKCALEENTTNIKELRRDNEMLKITVNDLSSRLNLMEQGLRESNIEINGIPEHRNENLNTTLIQLVKVIGEPVPTSDIIHATRVAKISKDSDRPRTVVVKLSSPKCRDAILAAVANFNKKNSKQKLSSQHLGLGGSVTPVFVSEHLSPTNKALHAITRKKAKEICYKFVWVRNGRIFVRKDEYSPAIMIRNKEVLNALS